MRQAPTATKINFSWYLVDTQTAAHLAHIQPATIRSWRKRGHVQRYGTHHRALWDIREILARAGALDT